MEPARFSYEWLVQVFWTEQAAAYLQAFLTLFALAFTYCVATRTDRRNDAERRSNRIRRARALALLQLPEIEAWIQRLENWAPAAGSPASQMAAGLPYGGFSSQLITSHEDYFELGLAGAAIEKAVYMAYWLDATRQEILDDVHGDVVGPRAGQMVMKADMRFWKLLGALLEARDELNKLFESNLA